MNDLRLVRVVAPHFVAGFETDGIVRRTAPILRRDMMGLTDREARKVIFRKGWKARIINAKKPPAPDGAGDGLRV
jgi:hypothetical protein